MLFSGHACETLSREAKRLDCGKQHGTLAHAFENISPPSLDLFSSSKLVIVGIDIEGLFFLTGGHLAPSFVIDNIQAQRPSPFRGLPHPQNTTMDWGLLFSAGSCYYVWSKKDKPLLTSH